MFRSENYKLPGNIVAALMTGRKEMAQISFEPWSVETQKEVSRFIGDLVEQLQHERRYRTHLENVIKEGERTSAAHWSRVRDFLRLYNEGTEHGFTEHPEEALRRMKEERQL